MIEPREGRVALIIETLAEPDENPMLDDVSRQVLSYFKGELREFNFAIEQEGTPFQKKVWDACRKIPYGETVTYKELACEIGCPGAARAVGAALAKNKILLAVPCHRVVASGSLGGFRLGSEAKKYLLQLERCII